MTGKATRTALGVVCVALLVAGAFHPAVTRGVRALTDGPVRSVVVVTRDLARGERISRATLDFRDLPERYLDERHIEAHDFERILDARAAGAVPPGSALLWSDLDVAVEGRTLAGLVRAGRRAFTLSVGELAVTGLLRPGDRVDVLFTRAGGDTVTLLQNVLLLTVGDELAAGVSPYDPRARVEVGAGAAPHAKASGRVTLSVDLEQAQRLAASEGRGVLRLALRNPLDVALVDAQPSAASASPALPNPPSGAP